MSRRNIDDCRNNKKASKKASIELSFQFIFSLFLIAAFIVAAVIVIKTVLNSAEHVKIAAFYQELGTEINKAWISTSTTKTLELSLPQKIEMACFSNHLKDVDAAMLTEDEKKAYEDLKIYKGEDANFYFYPSRSILVYKITPYLKIMCGEKRTECLNIGNLPNNFYCVKNQGGIVKITLEKKYDEKDVRIKP